MRKYENGKYQKLQNSDDTEDNINQRTMNRNLITNRIKLNKYINNNLRNNKLNALIFFIIFVIIFFFFLTILINKSSKNFSKNINNLFHKIIQSKTQQKDQNNNEENIKQTNNKEKENIKSDDKTDYGEKENKDEMKEDEYEEEEIKPKKEDIYKREYYDGFETSFRKAKNYLDNCMNGVLLHKEPLVISRKPKVSAVVPIYNSKNTVVRALRSIQNQNLLDIEIILVNDFSTDNTLSILQEFAKVDPRIKIINNKKNMGIIYTRSIGSLAAKGKYIFPLDNDDMFLDKDVFDTISKVADKGNFDIIEFRGVLTLAPRNNEDIYHRYKLGTTFSPYGDNIVLYQPELGNFPMQKGNRYGDYKLISVYLWSKCIKTKVYKKALNAFGEERYSRYMLRDEDLLVNYIIFNVAKSFKFIGKYGIIHIQGIRTASDQPDDAQMNRQKIYVLEAALEFSQKSIKNKEWIVYYITNIIYRPKLDVTLRDEYINKIFIKCLDIIFKTQKEYFKEKDRNEIKRRVLEKSFIKYKFD